MDFKKAVEIKEQNLELVGKNVNGAVIDEILIYPTKNESFQRFLQLYRRYNDADYAIAPFVNENVEVRCLIDKSRFFTQNFFAHLSIEEAKRN
ncbi:hypothetical protein [Christiangramia crocea]|uniref:Uncharacterized protein n=1 Tax=Christiangramia crocea TaxID=2904124 RepID=A0A9X1V081_9FLAO|nr:hypothetical protein [Gramella crocea]MCG9972769.1 hypothetical protein [Gramella crocea]